MKLIRTIIFYLLGVFGIICISVFPQYFATGLTNPLNYFKDLGAFLFKFVQPDSWVYKVSGVPWSYQNPQTVKLPLFETLGEPFIYSAQIFLGAILLGFTLAFVIAFVANFLSRRLLGGLKRILDFLESIPDLIIAVLLQMLSIYVYKSSGIDLFRVAGYGDEKIYFAPIVTLAILPMISLFRILLLRIEEESVKDYVGFLKSKGIKKSRILVRHVLRNVLPTVFQHSKLIIWATLSSQFIIEYLFNINGLTPFILESFNPMTISISLIMIFTPFFIFFQLIDLWLAKDPIYTQSIYLNNKSKNPIHAGIDWIVSLRNFKWQKFKPWKPFSYILIAFFQHMKNVKFALGTLFFIACISVSFVYSITTDNHVDQATIIYNEDGTIKSTPPHHPGEPFILGSDRVGFDLLDQMIIGAKFTLIFGLLIALLRVFIGLVGGIVFALSLSKRQQTWLEKLVDSIHFLPLSLIAYILLAPILYVNVNLQGAYTLSERIILETIILTVLVIPLTTVLLGNEIKGVLKNEFILSARVLGGSKTHVLWRHVLPHIGPRMAILIGQQFIQVLLVLIHLGVFTFFFGGTILDEPKRSVTNEWSGLIGAAKNSVGAEENYWLALWPLLAFMLTIFAMQFIIKGIKEVQQQKVGIVSNMKRYKKKKKENQVRFKEYYPDENSFKRADSMYDYTSEE